MASKHFLPNVFFYRIPRMNIEWIAFLFKIPFVFLHFFNIPKRIELFHIMQTLPVTNCQAACRVYSTVNEAGSKVNVIYWKVLDQGIHGVYFSDLKVIYRAFLDFFFSWSYVKRQMSK